MNEWLMPRALAALSAFALLLAVVYPLLGKFIAVGPLLFGAAIGAWTSHDMCKEIRERHQDAHEKRRAMHRRVNVWVLPPPRVSDDPDVAVLARIHATPAPRMWPLGGWNTDAVETPEYEGDIRRVAEQR